MERLANSLKKAKQLAERPRSFVYFFQCEGYTKIGYTRNLKTRRSIAQVDNPFEVRLLASFETRDPKRDEDLLHTLFEKYRLGRGEWFRLPNATVEFLRSCESLNAQVVVDEHIRKLGN